MALSNRDRIDRMFQTMAPALDDFIASVTGHAPSLDAAENVVAMRLPAGATI